MTEKDTIFTHYCDDNIRNKSKPLSDEEILHIYSESYRNTLMGIDPLAFAREIEERHGIK